MNNIERLNNGFNIRYNKITYNFPLNSLIIDGDESSKTINFRLKGGLNRKNIFSIHKDWFDSSLSLKEIINLINNIIYI